MKSRNPFISKRILAALVLSYFFITSACGSCSQTSGQICFSLDPSSLSNCTLPEGTKLCMISYSCKTTAELQVPWGTGGAYEMVDFQSAVPADTTCNDALGQTNPILHYTVYVWHNGLEAPGQGSDISYIDLFYSQYGRYPTPAEVTAITQSEVETWLASAFNKNLPAGFSITVTDDWTDNIPDANYPVCHATVPECPEEYIGGAPSGNDLLSFSGYLEFPDGTKCAIKPVSFDDEGGLNGWCANSNFNVSVAT